MKIFLCLGIFLVEFLNFNHVEPYRILVAYAHDSKSHFGSMIPLVKSLSQSNKVTFFYTTKQDLPPNLGPNVSYIHINMTVQDEERRDLLAQLQFRQTMHSFQISHVFVAGDIILEHIIEHHMEKILEVLNHEWDLVILDELFGMHAHIFAMILNRHQQVPYIVFSTTLMVETTSSNMALSRPWTSKPCMFSPIPEHPQDRFDPQSFYYRTYNFFQNLMEIIWIEHISPLSFTNMRRFLGHSFNWVDFYQKSSFSLSDTIDSMIYPMPEGSDIKFIGRHCEKAKKLEGDYLKFVEDPSSKGTIYIAFGSYVLLDMAPENFLKSIFDALEELDEYRIIFSYNGPPRKTKAHIFLTTWAPQKEILSHPKTKAYFTHGGLKSIKESICAKIPLIVMPLFAEQAHNADFILDLGTGSILNKFKISKELVLNTFMEVLENPSYKKNVNRLHTIYLDTVIPPLEEGKFSVEKVIKSRKASSKIQQRAFQRKGKFQTWLEFAYIDVLFCICLTIVFIYNKI